MEEEIQYKVYKITNKISGKFYIGYTKDINSHITSLIYNNHMNDKLQSSYNKYGIRNFTFEIIGEFDNIDECKEKELEYIAESNQ